MNVRSRWLKLAYQLHRHELNGWPLDRWLGALFVLVALASVLGRWPDKWLVASVAGVFLASFIAFEVWARRAAYVTFVAQKPTVRDSQSEHAPLLPQDKVEVRATGRFEVEGRSQFFVELQAFFRTFATREHAVIAFVPRSRFLWLGQWPEHERGLWYIFFLPRQVVSLEPGVLAFGGRERLALRVTYQQDKRLEAAYLSFDNETDRYRVWEDILRDAALQRAGSKDLK